jgi:hypothetical protein
MTFRIGQKVVCIHNGEWINGYGDEKLPIFNAVYSIRAKRIFGELTGILLNEIHNSSRSYLRVGNDECWFTARYFRPVVERKTDISVFQKMLIPQEIDA